MDLITQRLTVAKFLADIEPKWADWAAVLRSLFPDEDLDEMPFLRKGFVLEDSDLEMVTGERADISTISTLALDRDQEVLLPEGADLSFYKKNPIVPYAHDYWGLPIGTTEWVKIDSKEAPTSLVAKTRYASEKANPMAEQVYLLHKEKILRAKSVGFIPTKVIGADDDGWVDAVNSWRERRSAMLGRNTKEGDPRRIYQKWVLLEQSPVPVPSNPEALALAISKGILTEEFAKAYGLIEEEEDPPDPPGSPELRELVRELVEISVATAMEKAKDTDQPLEISEEHAQKILEMVGNTLEIRAPDSKPTVEDILEFARTGLV